MDRDGERLARTGERTAVLPAPHDPVRIVQATLLSVTEPRR